VSKPRRVVFLTGTRADYGKLKPLIHAVRSRPDRFEQHLFVTGMHTLARFGSTFREITKDGFANIYTFINQTADSGTAMDLVLANTVHGFGHYLREHPAELIVVHGDRVEALAGAIVGVLNNTLVAHIEGGELSGTVDEIIRHSVSKLAHLHFVANAEAKERLVQMGELPASVFPTGSPDIDIMLSADLPELSQVRARYEIDFPEYAVFCFHPVTTELDQLDVAIREVVDTLIESGRNYVVIMPNNDPGSDLILAAYRPLKEHPRFRLLPSMRFEYFLTLLRHARAVVGNSSAGIREAPLYGVPTINIGSRQRNRFDHPSIVHVAEKRDEILGALGALPSRFEPCYHFGTGDGAKRFLDAMLDEALWRTPRQKQFRDIVALSAT
jgi:UDP-N-acetylglucosamine 2-epimerase (hydrolysing)